MINLIQSYSFSPPRFHALLKQIMNGTCISHDKLHTVFLETWEQMQNSAFFSLFVFLLFLLLIFPCFYLSQISFLISESSSVGFNGFQLTWLRGFSSLSFLLFWDNFYSHIFMNLGTNMQWEGQGVVEAVFSTLRSLITMMPIQQQKKVQSLVRPFLHNLPVHQAPNTCLPTLVEIWIPPVCSKKRKDAQFKICLKHTLTPIATGMAMVYHQHTIHQMAVREVTALANQGKTCSWTRPLIGLYPSNKNLSVR